MEHHRVVNFASGPACLPLEVLKTAQREFLDYHGCGMSVCELSHRGKEFTKILEETKQNYTKVLSIPEDYSILFLVGGATAQFAALPLNLVTKGEDQVVDYIVTGSWSKMAAEEAKQYCKVNIAASTESSSFRTLPSSYNFSPNPAYIYYCENETIHGVEFKDLPPVPHGVPLVCDMSSSLLSHPIDVSKFGIIYGGTQKNSGIAGVTVLIIRKDLLARTASSVPSVINYKKKHESNSIDNTPPTFSIYMTNLVIKWIIEQGGLGALEKKKLQKASLVYQKVEESGGFYVSFVDKGARSDINIPLRVKGGDSQLEEKFIAEAEKEGLVELKGHRSVGGLRVSIYNAMDEEGIQRLVKFMDEFQKRYQ
eukprot:TRINITY_DN1344_c0_g2_i1.p1 TRINITY_DN1344_c0_g2~~TRINITY_DN1344_c0_g2_i1.p1  ORF type:complete len:367 (-),score=69.02 TRINITY_DN1344_c0_g2_i1:43-1143(-)